MPVVDDREEQNVISLSFLHFHLPVFPFFPPVLSPTRLFLLTGR
jgi:hypothetical protein